MSQVIAKGPNWIIHRWEEAETTVPYKSESWGDNRVNHTYLDLVAHPELIDDIPEVREFPPLGSVLKTINSSASSFMTSACDCGVIEQGIDRGRHFAAGGMVYMMFRDLALNRDVAALEKVAVKLADALAEEKSPHSYSIVLAPLKQLHGLLDCWGLKLEFVGLSPDETVAWACAEVTAKKLVAALELLKSPD